MKRGKMISAVLLGSLCLGPAGMTVVSCSDYDGDIENLQKQITANAETLDQLVNEKFSNLSTEVNALKEAQGKLLDAYKQADEDTKNAAVAAAQKLVEDAAKNLQEAIDKAQAQLDEQGKNVDGLLQANVTLETATTAAADQANKAYALAEEAKSTASDNKQALTEVSENLKTIKESLDGQIKVLGDDVEALTERVATLESGLKAQEAALDAYKGEQADEVAGIKSDIEKLSAEVDTNKSELEKLVSDQIATVKKQIGTDINAAVEKLSDAYEAADKKMAGDITALSGKIATSEEGMSKLSERVDKVEGLVNVLYTNLSNLVTGVILQDQQLQFFYAQVTADPNQTGISSLVMKDKDQVIFPYKGAANTATLTAGEYNVESNGGLIYVTLNPNTVDFEKSVKLQLENSLENAPKTEMGSIEVGEVEAAKGYLITRAAEPKNGLYAVRLSYKNTDAKKAPENFEGLYAVYANNAITGQDGKASERRVYSKYALELNMWQANAVRRFNIVPQKAEANVKGVDYLVDGLQAKFDLTPVDDANGKAGNSSKAFRKYVEIVGMKNGHNVALQGEELKKAIAAVNGYMNNANALNKVLSEPAGKAQTAAEPNGFDAVTIDVPEQYNGYTFELRYFVQSYNGQVKAKTITVLFTKPLFEETGISMSHTPTSALNQSTVTLKSAFNQGASCIINAENNQKWVANTNTIEIVSKDLKLVSVHFYDDKETPNLITSILVMGRTSATSGALNATQLGQIKNMVITYRPGNLEVEKEYSFTVRSLDMNGNLVSSLPVTFTMKYPTSCAGKLLKPNPAYFSPELVNNMLNGQTLTAWATLKGSNKATATYNMSPAFNNMQPDDEQCNVRFGVANAGSYAAGQPNAAYRPESFVVRNGDYDFTVPVAAVAYGKEHVYDMQVGVEYFGTQSLWYAPAAQTFKLVYKSPIAYADFKFDAASYEVGYPHQERTIGDAQITSDDPSTSNKDDITYFGQGRDARITDVDVELVDEAYKSLFKTIAVVDGGIRIVTAEIPAGGTGAISATEVTFNMIVKDQFGNTMKYPFKVKVTPNQGQN